jgi:flagellar motility protein MotE (MotC chaperone)
MILPLHAPRLLPITIAALAALLAMKAVDLARSLAVARPGAPTAVVAEARAAATDPPPSAGAKTPASPVPSGGAAAPVVTPPGTAPGTGAAIGPGGEPSAALPSPDGAAAPPISDGERAVLLELRQRSQQLDARAAALSARESILAAAEQKLEAQAQALTALQKKLQDLEAARGQRDEAGWQGLVKLYENMKPRDAATIFNDLDMPVLLSLVDRMKELKAAPILAAMNPDKARDVTAGLAKLRTRHDAAGTAAATAGPTAGPIAGPIASPTAIPTGAPTGAPIAAPAGG